MRHDSSSKLVLVMALALALPGAACTSTKQGFVTPGPAEEEPSGDFGETAPPPEEDLYAKDPPPRWCGPAGGAAAPPLPGGTEACPSDKNKPGCACDTVGEKAACWTGLRKNRKLGICKDGTTTCTQLTENTRGWGPCEGEVLPAPGMTTGKSACNCFSEGEWKLDNVVPCTGADYVVSTVLDATTGAPACPFMAPGSTPKKPPGAWSQAALTVDCAGHYELCFELKAGKVTTPLDTDCSIARVCVTTDYTKAGVSQKLPPLPSWISTNTACLQRWKSVGGYAEMTVKGLSVTCDAIDDGTGAPLVFNRLGYCPESCQANPSTPECKDCQTGGSGEF